MKFRTEIQPLPYFGLISHHDRIIMLGSCFTDNISSRLRDRMFAVAANPFGTLYNPASIHSAIERIAANRLFTAEQIHQGADGLWFSYDCHTKLNSLDRGLMLEKLNTHLTRAHEFLKQATVACITLGTAWVFTLDSTGQVVANCQKQPASLFTRTRMSVETCAAHLHDIITILQYINPNIRIILTVSPIRHLADGAHGNQLSKSTLLLACEQAVQNHNNVIYFPSYEIMMDDLRSYRFYASDMKHPSEVAIDYIYDIFAQSFFSNDTIELSQQALRLTLRAAHHPINMSDEAALKFRDDTINLINSLVTRHPELKKALDL